MSSDSCINKYVRSDENIILRGFKDTVNVRLWAISMTVIVVLTLMTLIIEKRKSQDITIIDSATGRMYHSRTSSRINYDVIEKLVMRSSYLFCERFYSYNSFTISEDRKNAVAMMATSAFEKLPNNWVENDEVETCTKLGAQSQFDWILNPTITYANEPNYISFCQFTRNVTVSGISKSEQKINVKLYWNRIDNYDYLTLENGLVLVGYEEISDNSKEMKDVVTTIKGALQ